MQDYTTEKAIDSTLSDRKETDISRDNCKGIVGIIVKGGLCRANKDDPYQPRDIEWYDDNVLNKMIRDGKISDGTTGKFDDRKMRYSGAEFALSPKIDHVSQLFIYLGHSHFLDYIEKKKRTKEESERLVQMGNEYFKDLYAFFGRNPGVTGIIKTSDKRFVVGERQVGEKDKYEGLLQGVAGHLTYKDNPEDINLKEEMLRETLEEVGIQSKISGLEFLGLFSDPSVAGDDLDFCYLVNSEVHSDFFKSGKWKENVKDAEHKELLLIDSYKNLDNLIRTGNLDGKNWDIVFSTRGALSTIEPEDFK